MSRRQRHTNRNTRVITIQGHHELVRKQRQTTRTNNATGVLVISGWLGTNCLSECVSWQSVCFQKQQEFVCGYRARICTWNHRLYKLRWHCFRVEASAINSIILYLSYNGSNKAVTEKQATKMSFPTLLPPLSTLQLFFLTSAMLAYAQHLQHCNSHSSVEQPKLKNKIKKKTHYTVLGRLFTWVAWKMTWKAPILPSICESFFKYSHWALWQIALLWTGRELKVTLIRSALAQIIKPRRLDFCIEL